MSVRIEHRVGVRASAASVWSHVFDLGGWGQWNPLYPSAKGRIGIGEILSLTEVLPQGDPHPIAGVVIDWVPEHQLIWRVKEGFLSSRLQFVEIDPIAADGVILAAGARFEGSLSGAAARRLGRGLSRGLLAMIEALKARSESS